MGVSTGASVAMMSSNLGLPKSVRGIIDDCGFTSTMEMIDVNCKSHLPDYIPTRMFDFFVEMGTSVFSRLKEESNWTLADAEPYIESLIAFYQDHHQTTFRVMEASEVRRLQRIPCRQVLQEIFDGKFIELKNGMLRYKQ